jgi:hypothetical protein
MGLDEGRALRWVRAMAPDASSIKTSASISLKDMC